MLHGAKLLDTQDDLARTIAAGSRVTRARCMSIMHGGGDDEGDEVRLDQEEWDRALAVVQDDGDGDDGDSDSGSDEDEDEGRATTVALRDRRRGMKTKGGRIDMGGQEEQASLDQVFADTHKAAKVMLRSLD